MLLLTTLCFLSIQVPEKLGAHLFHIGHDNPKGYIQRDAVSCRKDHRSSPLAHFAPGFDEEGSPISRTGYMHQCAKHSDCLACGRHPITSQSYKCQKRYVLYDTVMTDNENNLVFLNLTSGSASAFDPDLEDGAITGKTGICVDLDSSYNEGCSNKVGAMIKDSLIGCTDGPVGPFLCGLSLDVRFAFFAIQSQFLVHAHILILTFLYLCIRFAGQTRRFVHCVDERQPVLASCSDRRLRGRGRRWKSAWPHRVHRSSGLCFQVPLPGAHLSQRSRCSAYMRTVSFAT